MESLPTIFKTAFKFLAEAVKSRSLIDYLDDLYEFNKFYAKFRKILIQDFTPKFLVRRNRKNEELTKQEAALEIDDVKPNLKNRIYLGFKRFLDVATSPFAIRAMVLVGLGFAIASAIAAPVLWIAVLSTISAVVIAANVGYTMYSEVKKFRAQRNLQEERAMLEEMLLLRTQNKVIAEKLFGIKIANKEVQPESNWKEINKAKVITTTFLEKIPTTIIPLITNFASLNIAGGLITLGAYFLESGSASAKGVAYAKHKDMLINANAALARKLGIDQLEHGEQNDDLRRRLGEMRAQHYALRSTAGAQTQAKSSTFNAKETYKNNIDFYNKQVDTFIPPSKERTFWQDFKQVILKDGFSYAKNFRNFNPMVDEYREHYKTTPTPIKSKPKEQDIALEGLNSKLSKSKSADATKHAYNEFKEEVQRKELSQNDKSLLEQANAKRFYAERKLYLKAKKKTPDSFQQRIVRSDKIEPKKDRANHNLTGPSMGG